MLHYHCICAVWYTSSIWDKICFITIASVISNNVYCVIIFLFVHSALKMYIWWSFCMCSDKCLFYDHFMCSFGSSWCQMIILYVIPDNKYFMIIQFCCPLIVDLPYVHLLQIWVYYQAVILCMIPARSRPAVKRLSQWQSFIHRWSLTPIFCFSVRSCDFIGPFFFCLSSSNVA